MNMTGYEIIEEWLELFSENIEGVIFRTAFSNSESSRAIKETTVVLGVGEKKLDDKDYEIKFKIDIFLPKDKSIREAETIFSKICELVKNNYPQLSGFSRLAVKTDSVTGLMLIPCTVTFSYSGSVGETAGGKILISGEERNFSGVKFSVSRKSSSFTSVGETIPFAVVAGKTEYSVELSGFDYYGLEELENFAAELAGVCYLNCCWKSFSETGKKAVFTAGGRVKI